MKHTDRHLPKDANFLLLTKKFDYGIISIILDALMEACLKNSKSILVARILFFIYAILLLKLIVFKGSPEFISARLLHLKLNVIQISWTRANFIPLKTVYYYGSLKENLETGIQNIGGNILLLIPYGFLIPLAFPFMNKLSRLSLFVLFTSLVFELIQFFTGLGNFDVDDLLLNTVGGILGFLILLLFFQMSTFNRKRISVN